MRPRPPPAAQQPAPPLHSTPLSRSGALRVGAAPSLCHVQNLSLSVLAEDRRNLSVQYCRSVCHVRFASGADVVCAADCGEGNVPEGHVRVPRLPRGGPRVPASPQGHPQTRSIRSALLCAVHSPPRIAATSARSCVLMNSSARDSPDRHSTPCGAALQCTAMTVAFVDQDGHKETQNLCASAAVRRSDGILLAITNQGAGSVCCTRQPCAVSSQAIWL